MPLDPDRRAGLARTRLRALVSRAFPEITAEAQSFNAGAGLAQGSRAFVLPAGDTPTPMATLLAWGTRAGAEELHLILDEPDPVASLQARGLEPSPSLWLADGAELMVMTDVPVPGGLDAPAAALARRDELRDAGCEVVVEHGVVTGEVCGLEVARVTLEPEGTATVRVGVGVYDQEAHAVIHADVPTADRLRRVVSEVADHRRVGAVAHPLNRVARSRWIRSILMADPALAGVDELAPVQPLEARTGVRDERPATARGRRGATTVLVVCSTGIDLDLVPEAAGQQALHAVDEVVLVLPEQDHHPVIAQMAGRLAVPSRLIPAPPLGV